MVSDPLVRFMVGYLVICGLVAHLAVFVVFGLLFRTFFSMARTAFQIQRARMAGPSGAGRSPIKPSDPKQNLAEIRRDLERMKRGDAPDA